MELDPTPFPPSSTTAPKPLNDARITAKLHDERGSSIRGDHWTRSLGLSNSRSMDKQRVQRARDPGRRGAAGRAGHGQRLGAHPAGLEGGHFVRAPVGRVVVPSAAGGRAEHLAQLRRRGSEAHGRLRGRGDGDDRAVAGEGAALRDAGERDQGDRLGRRPGHLSDPAEAAHAGISARGGASAAAHQRDRRGDAGAAHAWQRRSIASSTRTAFSGSTRRSSPPPTRRGRGHCSGCRRWISPTCRAPPRARSISRRISLAARRS